MLILQHFRKKNSLNDGTKADMLYISIYYCDSTTILTNSVVEFVFFSLEYSMRCFSPRQAPQGYYTTSPASAVQ